MDESDDQILQRLSARMETWRGWIIPEGSTDPVETDFAGHMKWAMSRGGEPLRVGYDEIGGITVSTVFLSPSAMSRKMPDPALFETMVFGPGEAVSTSGRYSTWEEAEEGHALAVAEARREPGPDYHAVP